MERARKRGWNLIALDLGVDTSPPSGAMMASVLRDLRAVRAPADRSENEGRSNGRAHPRTPAIGDEPLGYRSRTERGWHPIRDGSRSLASARSRTRSVLGASVLNADYSERGFSGGTTRTLCSESSALMSSTPPKLRISARISGDIPSLSALRRALPSRTGRSNSSRCPGSAPSSTTWDVSGDHAPNWRTLRVFANPQSPGGCAEPLGNRCLRQKGNAPSGGSLVRQPD